MNNEKKQLIINYIASEIEKLTGRSRENALKGAELFLENKIYGHQNLAESISHGFIYDFISYSNYKVDKINAQYIYDGKLTKSFLIPDKWFKIREKYQFESIIDGFIDAFKEELPNHIDDGMCNYDEFKDNKVFLTNVLLDLLSEKRILIDEDDLISKWVQDKIYRSLSKMELKLFGLIRKETPRIEILQELSIKDDDFYPLAISLANKYFYSKVGWFIYQHTVVDFNYIVELLSEEADYFKNLEDE